MSFILSVPLSNHPFFVILLGHQKKGPVSCMVGSPFIRQMSLQTGEIGLYPYTKQDIFIRDRDISKVPNITINTQGGKKWILS